MLNQNATTDFYNLFVRTNELLFETLQQLKRIADVIEIEAEYLDADEVINDNVDLSQAIQKG